MIKLSDEQQVAIHELLDFCNDITVGKVIELQGLAGTGKTVLLSHLANKLGGSATVLSPTGKAAHVLRLNGIECNTVHSYIYKPIIKGNKVTGYKRSDAFSNVIVVDESSFVDQRMLNDLMESCNKLVLVGDIGQLPPVASGVVKIPSVKTITLKEIHRQARTNPIIKLAHYYRKQKNPKKYGSKTTETGSVIIKPYDGNLYIYEQADIVLCGKNKTKDYVNEMYRKHHGISDYLPVTSERVMILNNVKELGVFNGMVAIVERMGKPYRIGKNDVIDVELIDELGQKLPIITTMTDTFKKKKFKKGDIEFDCTGLGYKEAKETSKSIVFLDFCYACTVNKFQGSQAENVVVLAYDNWMRNEDYFRWLYTAVTRSSTNLIVEI